MSMLECFGQEGALVRLQKALRSGRVPHGYIFHGPEGVGKGLMARLWAKRQLCERPLRRPWPGDIKVTDAGKDVSEFIDSCDRCPDCRLADAGTHPDLHIIEKELAKYTKKKRERQLIDLPIDVVREFVIEPAGICPARGRARIFIIEQAQSMNQEAQNALLKTLEEPPPRTFLLLITSGTEQLLPTIRSRCQSVRFAALPENYVYSRLEQIGLDEVQAAYWADLCQGRLGAALLLAQMKIYPHKCRLVERFAQLDHRSVLTLAGELVELAKKYAQDYTETHRDLSQGDAERQGQMQWLDIIAHTYGAALKLAVTGSESPVGRFDQCETLKRMAGEYGPLGCGEAIRATFRARALLQANVNPTLVFETLLLEYLGYASSGWNDYDG